ncbi:hypothetical protein Taro_002503 [Colocasia esculenta]|uniref:Glycosyltransferase n=1 Tax=Colocasia esculenta TaxID=4460 RepID=A0A843TNZ2_COLES|nr:hypothetical protein [Colocasia esculenta]
MEADPAPHVAILPSPGIGHIIPLLAFGRRLVSVHGLRATVFIITTEASAAQSHLVRSAAHPDGLRLVELPPSTSDVPMDATIETRISVFVRDSLPSLRSALMASPRGPDVLVVDIFGTDAFDVADELGMYKTEDGYKWLLRHCRRFPMARGILVNTCAEMEPEPLAAMTEEPAFTEIPTPRVFPVGPLIHSAPDSPVDTYPLQWLDSQPEGSVLFVSFGSGGTLSAEQTAELGCGLELSGQRFLWVIRRPVGGSSAATFFTCGGDPDDPASYLPEGFTKRTEGRGFLLPSWAPQVAILRHPAVGGFMTHGGWNSILESLTHGVAMVVWPLYAEQRMNATKLEEELGVAVRVREVEEAAGGPVVRREEVERVARLLMEEGEERKAMKAKAAELREDFARVLGEGGSSRSSLARLVSEWRQKGFDDADFRRHLNAPRSSGSPDVSSSTVR